MRKHIYSFLQWLAAFFAPAEVAAPPVDPVAKAISDIDEGCRKLSIQAMTRHTFGYDSDLIEGWRKKLGYNTQAMLRMMGYSR